MCMVLWVNCTLMLQKRVFVLYYIWSCLYQGGTCMFWDECRDKISPKLSPVTCMEKWLSVLCSLWDRVAAAFPCAQGIDGTWRQCRWMLVGFIAQFWLLISRAWCVLVPGPAACLALLTLPSHRLPRCSSQNHDSGIKPVAAVLDSLQVSVVQRPVPVGHVCHAVLVIS